MSTLLCRRTSPRHCQIFPLSFSPVLVLPKGMVVNYPVNSLGICLGNCLFLRPFNPHRPFGPKLETELKMSSQGLPAPGFKKLKRSRKRVKKWKFQLFFNFCDSFSTLFLTFGTLGPEGPGNSFSTLFQTLGRRAQETPLGGWKGRKSVPKLQK